MRTQRNGTSTGSDMPDYSKAQEMDAFDLLPPDLKNVLREAPFDVSAADLLANQAVMDALEQQGADAPTWLAGKLAETYRTKILAACL